MSKKKKFSDVWKNQTEIGKLFDLSAIEVGKKLIEIGLKDANTKKATEYAIKENYAKETPLKDGTYFCMWNKNKIRGLFSKDIKPLTQEELYVNQVLEYKKKIEELDNSGQDKLAGMMWDSMYDDVPKEFRAKIRDIIEKRESEVYDL